MSKRSEYVETESGNRISRRAVVVGSQNIVLGGRTTVLAEAVLRGDLAHVGGDKAAIEVGRYCAFDRGVVLRPPGKAYKGVLSYYPVRVHSYVVVHADAVVQAAAVGPYVQIGRGAVVGAFAIVKECVLVLAGAVVPDGTVVPAHSVVGGNPARVVGVLGEAAQDVFERRARQIFAAPPGDGTRVFDDAGDDAFDWAPL
ncbi:putative dynactin Arp1 p25 subunit RO12 [Dipodascopsis tothii]|uniref:putative dynactin Arp1 p25 subunit RO12 n=1 Tax=Dipodascopsis tothii TaxID=44089 RepID=UPI0034CD14AC